ncbi:MAG: hypothetical protein GY751_08225, partial [Bacteroidetes bacterium]|nr:hypothetical protein [Bacteroidota bacterium]
MRSMRHVAGLFTMLFFLTGWHSVAYGQYDLQFDNVDVFSECSQTGELLNVSFTVRNQGIDFDFSATPPFVNIYSDVDGSGGVTAGDQLIVSEVLPGFLAAGNEVDIENVYILPNTLQSCPLLLVIEDDQCQCGPFEYLVSSVPYLNAGKDVALCNGESGQLGCGSGVQGFEYIWSAVGDADLNALSAIDIADPVVSAVNLTEDQVVWQYVVTTDKGFGSCTYTDTVDVFICPLREIVVCEGEELVLPLGQINADSVVWTGPGGLIVNTVNLTISDAGSSDIGEYQAVAYLDGCVAGKVCVFVDVTPSPEAPQPSANGPLCTFDTLKLFANTTADVYIWSGPNGFSSSDQNPVLTGLTTASSGIYELVIGAGECLSTPGEVEVSIIACDCDEFPDSAVVACNDLDNQTGDYCLPLPFLDFISGYDLYIDGELQFDLPFICDLDTAGGYDFSTVIGNGSYGGSVHILMSWIVDGVDLVANDFTYSTFEELVAFMQSVDPAGGWTSEDDRIKGGLQNRQADYGTLSVFSPEIGALAEVSYNLGVTSLGTLIEDIPNGCHWLTLVNTAQPLCPVDSIYVCVECSEPSVDIEKHTNGEDADSGIGPIILVDLDGEIVGWEYFVTNTGDVDLADVVVVDDMEGTICTIPLLAAGESTTCTFSADAELGMYHNMATVTGTPVDSSGNTIGDPVTDEDPSNYTGVWINVDKSANADTLCGEGEVLYNLTVRMLGGAPGIQIRDIAVMDNNLPGETLTSGSPYFIGDDFNGNGWLDFVDLDGDQVSDEEFMFEYTLTLTETTINVAMDTGQVWYQGPQGDIQIGAVGNRDSVTVIVLDPQEITLNRTSCSPADTGTVVTTFDDMHGCDSVVTIITTLLPSYEVTVMATTCDEQQVDTSSETFEASNGCDSIVTTITELLLSYEVT